MSNTPKKSALLDLTKDELNKPPMRSALERLTKAQLIDIILTQEAKDAPPNRTFRDYVVAPDDEPVGDSIQMGQYVEFTTGPSNTLHVELEANRRDIDAVLNDVIHDYGGWSEDASLRIFEIIPTEMKIVPKSGWEIVTEKP